MVGQVWGERALANMRSPAARAPPASLLQLRPQFLEDVLHLYRRRRPGHVLPTVVSHHEKSLIVGCDREGAPGQRSYSHSVRDREQDAGRLGREGWAGVNLD